MDRNPTTAASTPSQLTNVSLLLVDDDKEWARTTARLLEAADVGFDVTLAHSLAEGRSQFEATDPECVVCDYQLGDGTGLALLKTVRAADPDQPFVLVTGRGDETVASEAIGNGVTDYILKDHDDTDSTLLANRVMNAVESARAKRQLDRERRGKATTLNILTSTTSMSELLGQFCRVLVSDHGYAGAWIGGIQDDSGEIVPQAVEGCESYLDALAVSGSIPIDSADPVVSAVDRDSPLAVSAIDLDEEAATHAERYTDSTTGWQQLATEYGFVTAAAIPIRHDGIREGVLGVYRSAESPPFDEQRWELLKEYARLIGYAYRTAELKRSLLSDSPVRVDIKIRDTTAPLAELTDQLDDDVTLTVLSTIQRANSELLYLAEVAGTNSESLRSAAAGCDLIELQTASAESGTIRCDLLTTAQTPEEILVAHGAQIDGAVSSGGAVTISVSVSDQCTVSTITTALRSEYDDVTITTRWNDYDAQPSTETDDPLASLTDKQRNVLSHAYFDGYFEQPRGVSATELAGKFGIARVTMTQHLRTAQRKVFEHIFE